MIKRYSSYTKNELFAKRAKLEEDLANLCMQWEEDTDLEISDVNFYRQYAHVQYEQNDGSFKQGDPKVISIQSYIGMGDKLFAQLKKDD